MNTTQKPPKIPLGIQIKNHILDGLAPLFLIFCMAFFAYIIYEQATTNYTWQWARVWRYLGVFTEQGFKAGVLLKGLKLTLLIAFYSLILSFIIGISLAFMQLSCSPVLGLFSRTIIRIIRNTPLLIQLFLCYFVISPVLHLTPFITAILCLALFEGVYVAEIIRSGIITIPHTQWEASFSLGMNTRRTLQYVIMPQVLRNILPSLAGQFISLIKDTSLVSTIAVADLTLEARNVISETYLSFEIWILVAIIYFTLTLFINIPVFFLTHKLKHKNRS